MIFNHWFACFDDRPDQKSASGWLVVGLGRESYLCRKRQRSGGPGRFGVGHSCQMGHFHHIKIARGTGVPAAEFLAASHRGYSKKSLPALMKRR